MAPDAYDALVEHVQRYESVGDAAGLLQWDQQVMMPPGGTPARSKQSSALSTIRHELLTDDDVGRWLDELADADLTDDQAALCREVRREHERARRVPDDLVAEIAETTSDALPVWEEAREADDFSVFADTLAEIVELKREYAAAIDPDRDPYAVLFEEYEPYLGIETAERVLGALADELPALIDDVAASNRTMPDPFEGTYPESHQEDLVRSALTGLGYDWDRGRLDTAPHPFTSGTQFDARVTTRFDPEDPLDALGSTIHEFGHACYVQGLPDEDYGTPLGDDRDLVVHESQSRLWENHVGRSQPFWEWFGPTVADELGVDADPEALYRAANAVDPNNAIRVEADELTYHMHVVLRYEIERDLIRGDLAVDEVPAVWESKMEEYLGVTPAGDAEGALQDIHWTNGAIGYFPTYSLGSVLAAQVYDAAADALAPETELDAAIAEGRFDPLREWLRESIHAVGRRQRTDDLIAAVTGGELTAEPFLDYADAKYRSLYDC